MYGNFWSFLGAAFSITSIVISAWLVHKMARFCFSISFPLLFAIFVGLAILIYIILWQIFFILTSLIFFVVLCAVAVFLIYMFRLKKKGGSKKT